MIATNPNEKIGERLSHAALAERLFRLMHEAFPDSEHHKAQYKMAKDILDHERLDPLEVVLEVERDEKDLEKRYKEAKEAC